MPDRAYWVNLAKDYVVAWKLVVGRAPTRREILMAASPAEFETNNGRAWGGTTNNFGAVQGRKPTAEEAAQIASGELKAGARLPGYVLQYDTNPDAGGAKYAMWFVAFATQVEGITHYLRVLLKPHARAVLENPDGALGQLAAAMYLAGYYQGSAAGARPYYQRVLPFTVPEQKNVDTYTAHLSSAFRHTIEPNMGEVLAQLLAEEQPPPMDPSPKPIDPGSDFASRLALSAIAHCGCSAHVNQDKYIDVIVRPANRGGSIPGKTLGLMYFCGPKPPSTCGLYAAGLLRLEGLDDPELVDPYKSPPGAVADIQKVAQRHGILEAGTPKTPFVKGDIVIIDEIITKGDGTTYDNAHVFVCAADAVVSADGKTWMVDIAQGGQVSKDDPTGGSSAISRTTATIKKNDNGKWYVGSRWVYATIRCSKIAIVAAPTLPAPPIVEPAPPVVEEKPVEPTPTVVVEEKPIEPAVDPATSTPAPKGGASLVQLLVVVAGLVGTVVAALLSRC